MLGQDSFLIFSSFQWLSNQSPKCNDTKYFTIITTFYTKIISLCLFLYHNNLIAHYSTSLIEILFFSFIFCLALSLYDLLTRMLNYVIIQMSEHISIQNNIIK